MKIDHRKVARRVTEQRIIDALAPGYRLIRVNWKKRKLHIVNVSGHITIRSLHSVAQ